MVATWRRRISPSAPIDRTSPASMSARRSPRHREGPHGPFTVERNRVADGVRVHPAPRANGRLTTAGCSAIRDVQVQPARAAARRSSSASMSMACATPASPATASPYRYARPTSTAFAPPASAMRMSVPRRIPESTMTSTEPPTAETIFGRTSIVAGTWSSCRPPWLETITASTPMRAASRASSAEDPFDRQGTRPFVPQPLHVIPLDGAVEEVVDGATHWG